eukprot:CAMPEP_0206582096 /NCGR_PEP_ID=MMETSP0325_2-20121206/34261_1 /ASSEMBLY_ACC=CAM_ASM_000347 /TAXON_ID=2866 /ORGANISM="Crypthecodinium cohnii, Strain Seligo" /LENGTH=124 /DNA_ID=CAMNT_0054088673 /DNA_START=52 /DNA_END=422 /DNA_ORIENTATION=+
MAISSALARRAVSALPSKFLLRPAGWQGLSTCAYAPLTAATSAGSILRQEQQHLQLLQLQQLPLLLPSTGLQLPLTVQLPTGLADVVDQRTDKLSPLLTMSKTNKLARKKKRKRNGERISLRMR